MLPVSTYSIKFVMSPNSTLGVQAEKILMVTLVSSYFLLPKYSNHIEQVTKLVFNLG